jgi:hypothetical protein
MLVVVAVVIGTEHYDESFLVVFSVELIAVCLSGLFVVETMLGDDLPSGVIAYVEKTLHTSLLL